MSESDHECEFEELVSGLAVSLDFESIQRVCPQHDARTLGMLLERHAVTIAAHMVSAGLSATAQLFNQEKGQT